MILVMFTAQCCFCFALFSLLIVDLGVGGGDKGRGAKTVIMPSVNKPHNRPFNGLKGHNENTPGNYISDRHRGEILAA